jgi:hypothetical protein
MPAPASSCVGIFNFIILSMIVGGGSCFEEPFVSFQSGVFLKQFYKTDFLFEISETPRE